MKQGTIIQITDDTHPWFPALLIVDEVKSWGVQACCMIPENNQTPKSCGHAYNRLNTGTFKVVGEAEIYPE